MSIENLPLSAGGKLRIRNMTHYNTEDIVALVNAVEKQRSAAKFVWAYHVERSSVEGVEKVLELREFTGKPRQVRKSTGGPTMVRLLAPARWRRPLTMRLVPPDKIYDSPLQSLSQAVNEEAPMLPEHMVEELAYAVASLFRSMSYADNERDLNVRGLKVRIETKRIKGNKKHAALARKRELLHTAHLQVLYRGGNAAKGIQIAYESALTMLANAKALGMDMSKVQAMVDSLQQAAILLHPLEERSTEIAKEAQMMVDAC
jgi:hypothetical protein